MPLGLVASEVTNTSARLSWDEPMKHGTPDFTFYKLIVKPVFSSGGAFQTVSVTRNRDVYLSGLAPATSYTATVAAVIAHSSFPLQQGNDSVATLFTTLEEGQYQFALI